MSNKMRLSLFRLLFILITLSLGCNNARAEEVTFKLGDAQGKGSYYGAPDKMIKDGITIAESKFYYGSSNYCTFYEGGTITITPEAGITITKIVINTKEIDFNGYQNGGAYAPSAGVVSMNADNHKIVEWYGATSASFTIAHTKSIHWVTIVVTFEKNPATLQLSATDGIRYFATFCNSNNVAFPKTLADGSSLSVSAVTVKKGNAEMVDIATSFSCEMDDKVIVPANTGVLLVVKGASATPLVPYYVFLGDAPGNTDDLNATNLLIPCLENGNCPSRAGANLYYKLAYGDYTNKTNLGFWWGNDDGSNAFTVKSGGAVLCVPQTLASNARGFTLDNDDMLTVIGCYIDKDSNGMTYNLSGRRVTREYRGVRIEKGRKCIR